MGPPRGSLYPFEINILRTKHQNISIRHIGNAIAYRQSAKQKSTSVQRKRPRPNQAERGSKPRRRGPKPEEASAAAHGCARLGQGYQASIRAPPYPPRATAERDEVDDRPLGRSLTPGNRGPRGDRPPGLIESCCLFMSLGCSSAISASASGFRWAA